MPRPQSRPIELKTTPIEGPPPPFRPPLSPPPVWLPLQDDDDRVYRDLVDAGMPTEGIVSVETLYQAVCRFQLRMGITVDGDVGVQTQAAFASAEILRPKPTYWDGSPETPHGMATHMPWFLADGLIVTQENVSPTRPELDAAKLVRVNFREELGLIEPEWQHMFLAVVLTESSGRRHVEPRYEPHLDDYSFGPAQILFATAKGLGYTGDPDGLSDPMVNAVYCLSLLKRNRRRKLSGLADPILEVACYNAGGVYPSGRNAWGIRHYGSHLTRFVRNWNAITLSKAD
jgi:hypothetical protein